MYSVIKRDGQKAEFQIEKISGAIRKAFNACKKEISDDQIGMIALRVTSDFAPKVHDGCIDVETIQDSVEKILSRAGYADVAKAYILYRKSHESVRNISGTTLDYKKLVNNYLTSLEDRDSESNLLNYSVGGLILSNSGAITANYWLSEAYDEEIAQAHRSGDMYIHDLSMLTGYSAGWSLRNLIRDGLGGVSARITSSPAKHLSTLCNQMVNFLGIMQNEWAGAQSFSSFDTYLAPFVRYDHLSYEEVKQAVQCFIYGVNTPSRWGTQIPFTNISLDWTVPSDLKDEPAVVGGKELDFTYGDCRKEMDMINKAFIEIMAEGDADGQRFQYPIPSYFITEDFDWSESENNRLLFEMTAKYGTPYFINYMSPDMEPGDVRYTASDKDLNRLYRRSGGFFASGESTGAIGAVTINLPRIAYLAEDEEDFFRRLDRIGDLAARSLKVRRTIISGFLEAGLYPYTKKYIGTFDNHFSVIGIVGMNEAGLNAKWLNSDLTDVKTRAFARRVLLHLREKMIAYQQKYGDLYSLEATPAENASYQLAKKDRKDYPDIITAGDGNVPYYTNSSHLPAGYTDDVFSALDIQDDLQPLYTSGTVFHVFLNEKIADWRAAALLVRKITQNYRLPVFTVSPVYSVCAHHGYLIGEQEFCPVCGEKTEIFSRVSGYYKPISSWNAGKIREHRDRSHYVTGHQIIRTAEYFHAENQKKEAAVMAGS